MKLDLLTNATVVDDAIRFVAEKSKDKEEKLKSSLDNSTRDGKEESNEPDYDEGDKDHLKEEEEETCIGITTNQVF
jgi:hypothetical protein